MNDKIDSALKRADLHAQALREDAKQSELPGDPAAWLDWQEQRATALPDDLPQKEYVLRCVQIARGQLSNENTLELRAWMIKIQKNMENAALDNFVTVIETQRSEGGRATAQQRKDEAGANMAEAVRLWNELGSSGKAEHERGNIIAQRMGIKADTVRRWIRKTGLR